MTILLMVFCLVFVHEGASAQSVALTHLPTKIEYLHSFSKHGHSINYADIYQQIGKVAISGDIYGLHHGTIGAASITVPMSIGQAKISPGFVMIFGRYETGPGFATRWDFCKGVFCTEGTAGVYHPLTDSRNVQFLADPIDLDLLPFQKKGPKLLKKVRFGYGGEFGRYGKYGLETDKINSGHVKIPILNQKILTFAYVPSYHTFRAGFTWVFGKNEH